MHLTFNQGVAGSRPLLGHSLTVVLILTQQLPAALSTSTTSKTNSKCGLQIENSRPSPVSPSATQHLTSESATSRLVSCQLSHQSEAERCNCVHHVSTRVERSLKAMAVCSESANESANGLVVAAWWMVVNHAQMTVRLPSTVVLVWAY